MGIGKRSYGQKVVGSRGGRLVKWRGKVCSIAPVPVIAAIGVVGITTAAVMANTIDSAETTTQSVGAADDLTITQHGSVSVTGATDAVAIEVEPNFSGSVDNQGAVTATMTAGDGSDGAAALFFEGDIDGGSVVSTGSITV